MRADDSPLRKDHGRPYEQSVAATLDLVGQLAGMDAASAAAPDIGAAANSVCPEKLERHTSILKCWGVPRAETCPARARFKFGVYRHSSILKCWGVPRAGTRPARAKLKVGDGDLGEVRRAAEILVAIDGGRGEFTASLLEAAISALLRRGAMGALGGQLAFARTISTLSKQGVDISLKSDGTGH